MLEIKKLKFDFKGKEILNDVTFDVPRQSICGLLGPNGTGKSTLIKLILGVLNPTSGQILVNKLPMDEFNRIELLRKIGSLIEQASLYEYLNPLENLELARRIYGTEKGYSEELLSFVKLEAKANQKVKFLSLGMKQRLGLAMAMIGKPELVILDEPTNGLDPDGLNDLRDLILKFNQEKGTTFFVSSHHLSELEKIATHVTLLQNGTSTPSVELKRMEKGELDQMYFNFTKQSA